MSIFKQKKWRNSKCILMIFPVFLHFIKKSIANNFVIQTFTCILFISDARKRRYTVWRYGNPNWRRQTNQSDVTLVCVVIFYAIYHLIFTIDNLYYNTYQFTTLGVSHQATSTPSGQRHKTDNRNDISIRPRESNCKTKLLSRLL